VLLMNDDMFDIPMTVPSTMAAGRSIFQSGLQGWGCGNVADMTLVFSELVANATVHAAGASSVVISHAPPTVRMAVHDSSHVIPALRERSFQGGFGLGIVNQLSDSWGWDQTPTGKVVWSVIRCGH
jgi:anti-sigma regulatory factor (Ser/Thr protein kinase)